MILTSRFGELDYQKEDVITFPHGIPGVENYCRYVLLPADEQEETPFYFLQSVEEGELCFFLLDTLAFYPDYECELSASDTEHLQVEQAADVLVTTIVTVKGKLKEATTNLKAPLIINHRQKVGKQIVLEKEDYLIRQPLFVTEFTSAQARQGG